MHLSLDLKVKSNLRGVSLCSGLEIFPPSIRLSGLSSLSRVHSHPMEYRLQSTLAGDIRPDELSYFSNHKSYQHQPNTRIVKQGSH